MMWSVRYSIELCLFSDYGKKLFGFISAILNNLSHEDGCQMAKFNRCKVCKCGTLTAGRSAACMCRTHWHARHLAFPGDYQHKNPRKRYARIIRPSEFRTSVVGASWQGPS